MLSKLFVSVSNKIPSRYYCCMKPIICKPPPKPMTATIIGAACPVGKILSLLLKQCPILDVIRLYDTCDGPCGIAIDLSHIDTNTKVYAFTGTHMLRDAIIDAQIVICCCGQQLRPGRTEAQLFDGNADEVRNVAMHMTEFNPKGVFCIASPPVNALVPMVSQEYKKARVYDNRKIIGITTISCIRANSMIGCYSNTDPSIVMCPVIGGLCPRSTVAIISQAKPCTNIPFSLAQKLRSQIANAEEEVLDQKYIEHGDALVVSPAYAISRFVTSLAKALKGDRNCVECAFVRQVGHIGKFLPYMASIVKLGVHGIESSHMPKVDDGECKDLDRAASVIRRGIALGECYVTGEFPRIRRRRSENVCKVIKSSDEVSKKPEETDQAKKVCVNKKS